MIRLRDKRVSQIDGLFNLLLGLNMRDDNSYQTPIGSPQAKCDVVRRRFTVSVGTLAQLGKEFSSVVKHFGSFFSVQFGGFLCAVCEENLSEEEAKSCTYKNKSKWVI